jgi:hypothetical protein
MTILGRLAVSGCLAGAVCLLWPSSTFAQPYPSKPVRVLCALPASS